MDIIKRFFLTLIVIFLGVAEVLAQPGIPGGDGCDPDDPDSCPVPLDNWLIVLFAAGLIFTAWYLHNKQKKEAVA